MRDNKKHFNSIRSDTVALEKFVFHHIIHANAYIDALFIVFVYLTESICNKHAEQILAELEGEDDENKNIWKDTFYDKTVPPCQA